MKQGDYKETEMKLKNVLVVAEDMERSVAFYKELFGLSVILDQDGNVIMTEGLVLQDKAVWEGFIGRKVISENNSSGLYFEEPDIETFAERLEQYPEPVRYVTRLMEHSWGQRVIRFYDPAGNLIEVGTPM